MGSTTPGKTGRWSMWASPTTRPNLRWKASGDGGNWTGERAIRRRGDYSSVPMLGGATKIDFALEATLTAAGGSDSDTDHGLSLPSGDQQVEQDRAPAILVYQSELERSAVD